jgi:hypothetical protein
MTRGLLLSTVLLIGLATSRVSVAGDIALAESLFRQGRELMDKGDYPAACPKLAESFAQDPATGTLLALAMCQERAGKTASAWATYAEVVSRAKQDGRADREEAARKSMQDLEPKLSKLTIEVDATTAAVPGLVVKRDTLTVGSAAWGAASPVDPGEHVVEATAPGKQTWKGAVTIGPNADAQIVKVPPLIDDPSQATAVPEAPPAAQPTALATPQPGQDTSATVQSSPLRTAGIVVGAAGVVALGVGGYFGLSAKSLNEDSKAAGHCGVGNDCDEFGLGKRNDAVSAATTSTILFIAGGVLAATGVTLFIVGKPKEAAPAAANLQLVPTLAPGIAGALASGHF